MKDGNTSEYSSFFNSINLLTDRLVILSNLQIYTLRDMAVTYQTNNEMLKKIPDIFVSFVTQFPCD